MQYENTTYQSVLSGYQGSPAPKPFFHSELKESLETVVLKDVPEKEQGIAERIFSDKGKSLKATIKALFNEIQLREKLDTFLVYKINDDMCAQKSQLEHLKGLRTHYNPDWHNDVSKNKKQLEGNLLELEREKRKEYIECWRDLMFMKKYLMTSLKDYWDMAKKRNMLSLDMSDIANNDENSKGYRGSMQEA